MDAEAIADGIQRLSRDEQVRELFCKELKRIKDNNEQELNKYITGFAFPNASLLWWPLKYHITFVSSSLFCLDCKGPAAPPIGWLV